VSSPRSKPRDARGQSTPWRRSRVNLAHLRAVARHLKTRHELALQLWATGGTAARLLATLVCRPKGFSAAELDAMVRDIGSPKLLDWFIVNVVKPGRHAERLRPDWKDGADLVGRAGWSLTTEKGGQERRGLDVDALLEQIGNEMKQAPAPKQWAMNYCLAGIGIQHPRLRAQAIAIGDRLAVLIDYPSSPGCTPPYAPLWIAEMFAKTRGAEVHNGRGAAFLPRLHIIAQLSHDMSGLANIRFVQSGARGRGDRQEAGIELAVLRLARLRQLQQLRAPVPRVVDEFDQAIGRKLIGQPLHPLAAGRPHPGDLRHGQRP
jgi:3-methyladenine DNA glycosylase AlkD